MRFIIGGVAFSRVKEFALGFDLLLYGSTDEVMLI